MTSPSEQLSAYLDGELSPEERASVDAALVQDPALREELEGLRGVVHWVREQGPVEAPSGFAESLQVRLAEEADPTGGSLHWLRRPLGVPIEVLALAAAALWVTLNLAGPGTQSEEVAGRAVFDAPGEAAEPVAEAEQAPPAMSEKGDQAMVRDGEGAAAAPAPAPPMMLKQAARPAAPEAREIVAAEPELQEDEEELDDALAQAEAAKLVQPLAADAPSAQGSADAPALSAVPFAYTLSADSPDVLRQLDRLARKHGGQLQDERGRVLSPEMMSAGTARVFVMLPNSQIGPFSRAMEMLGLVNTTATQTFFPGRTVRLQVDVDYEPGSTRYRAEPDAEASPSDKP